MNTVANASLGSRFLIPGYQYDIFRPKRWNLGFQVQLEIFDVAGSFNAARFTCKRHFGSEIRIIERKLLFGSVHTSHTY